MADEGACFANTPGGGALIVGVDNKSGDLLGTNLDQDRLRHSIYTRVDLAPLVEARELNGVRLLLSRPADRTSLEMSVFDVEGGDVVLRPMDMSGLSVLEQFAAVEARLETVNTEVTIRGGSAESSVRRLPPASVCEAVLNGLAHRDWLLPEPVVPVMALAGRIEPAIRRRDVRVALIVDDLLHHPNESYRAGRETDSVPVAASR